MLRWRDRLLPVLTEDEPIEGDTVYDFTYAFFQSSYHLQDWMLATMPALKTPLAELFGSSFPMKMCRDICNSTKHFDYKRPTVDPQPRIGFEWGLAEWGMPGGWYLQSDERWSIKDLMHSCITSWDKFIAQHDLSDLAQPELRWGGR
jgi:hypothetical protein